jgi:hypothetical protein
MKKTIFSSCQNWFGELLCKQLKINLESVYINWKAGQRSFEIKAQF